MSAVPDAPLGETPSRATALYGNAYFLLALASLFWSGNHIMGRAVAGHVPPLALSTLRWLLAAAILWLFARRYVIRDWPVIRRHFWVLFTLSIGGGALFSGLQFGGLQLTTALNVSVMNSLVPVLIAAAGAVMFGDRLTRQQLLGVTVSLAGVLVIISRLDPAILTRLAFNWGDIIILFNLVVWAIYSVSLRLRPPIHGTSFLFVFCLISAVFTLPFFALEHVWWGFKLQATPLTAFAIVFVAIVATIGAIGLWNRGVELIGANRAGIFLHLIPVYSALLTGVLLGEPLMGYHVVGFALILAGVWLAARRA
jgi:drug/metabolite transporter (DMT)-like permease